MKKLLLAAALAMPGTAIADHPAACGDYQVLVEYLTATRGEVRLPFILVGPRESLEIYVNKTESTWTIMEVSESGACFAAAGNGLVIIAPEIPK